MMSAMILISCSCPTPNPGSITRPASLIYPKISGHKLQCLGDKTYKDLNIRRVMCESRVKTLENSIDKFNSTK